jgi:hypothetical protein
MLEKGEKWRVSLERTRELEDTVRETTKMKQETKDRRQNWKDNPNHHSRSGCRRRES